MRKIICFTAATLLMANAFAAGEIYRWKGPDGTWHYSDQPRAGAELVRGSQTGRPTPSPAPAAPAPVAQPQDADTLPVSREVVAEVRAEAAAIKAERCKAAEEHYQAAMRARRLHRTDENGNRVYLSDAEADQARIQARANRDLACN